MANGTNYIISEILMSLFDAQLIIKRTRKYINLIPLNISENLKWKFVLAVGLVVCCEYIDQLIDKNYRP